MSDIILAPFSNSDIRDWPPEHFAELIRLLIGGGPLPGRIRVVGTQSQRLRANDIVRAFDPVEVPNECGRLSWSELLDELRAAACVVGNNSGIAHLAGSYGTPTVCVFGGSHSRLEWRPRGANLVLLSRSIACSPCHLDHDGRCPYDKACLRRIEPSVAADAVLALVAKGRGPGGRQNAPPLASRHGGGG